MVNPHEPVMREMSTVPAGCAGAIAETEIPSRTRVGGVRIPPKETEDVPVRPEPRMLTVIPPPVQERVGEMELITSPGWGDGVEK